MWWRCGAVLLIWVLLVGCGGPPAHPHPAQGYADCLGCHTTGVEDAPLYPADHDGLPNEFCQRCHESASTPAPPA